MLKLLSSLFGLGAAATDWRAVLIDARTPLVDPLVEALISAAD